jgi:hypothetical protein
MTTLNKCVKSIEKCFQCHKILNTNSCLKQIQNITSIRLDQLPLDNMLSTLCKLNLTILFLSNSQEMNTNPLNGLAIQLIKYTRNNSSLVSIWITLSLWQENALGTLYNLSTILPNFRIIILMKLSILQLMK